MSFSLSETGFERGATKLVLSRAPRILNRWNDGGPVRASVTSLPGTSINVEYHQAQDRRELVLALEAMTETQVSTLRDLLDGVGPVVVKLDPASATTINCSFTNDVEITPIIGAYPENAPTRNRWHRAELKLTRL